MGFWDFIAPNFDDFKATVEPMLPALVWVGPVPIPRDLFILNAWANPGSGAGLALRVYYETQHTAGGTRSQADTINNAINQQSQTVSNGSWVATEDSMTLVISNVYRVAIRMLAGGRDVTNVIGVQGSSSGQEAAAAAAVLAAWKVASGPLAFHSSLVTMQDVTAIDLSSTSGGIAIVADTTAGGVSASNALSTRASAALVTFNGGTRSKSSRGRMYFGPLRETVIDPDGATFTSSAVSTLSTAITNMRNSLSTAGFPLCVISQKNAAATLVTSHAVQSTIGTQRRRLRS